MCTVTRANLEIYTVPIRLLFGMEPDLFVGKTSLQLGLSTEFTQIETIIDSVFDKGKTRKVIHYIDVPTRGRRFFESVVNSLFNDQSTIDAIIVIANDITERLTSEEEQRKQKILYENLVENFPDIVARHDRNHRYLFVNSALERNTGIASCEIVGKTFDSLGFPEEIWQMWRNRCEEVFETGETITFDTEFSSPKGIIKLETMLIPECNKEGHPETLLTISRLAPRQLKHTQTQLEQANEELRKERRYFATIIENIPMVISRFDKDLRHIYASPASEALYGVKAEQCLGKNWCDMGMDEAVYLPFYRYYEEVFSTGRNVEFETKFPNPLGEMACFRTLVIPEVDELGQVQTVLSIAQDITEKKRLEMEISRLDQLNIVGEMAASIGHEVRNPMTTVRGYLQWYSKKDTLVEYRESFALMIEELDRAISIITDFLSLAKDKRGNLRLTDRNRIIQNIFPLLQSDVLRRGNNIELELQEILEVFADENEMRQCILNLVGNGLDAMPDGGKLTISTAKVGHQVIMTVRDKGLGISHEIKDKIGIPFFTTKENGTGLGLSICYQIAQRHKAIIEIETGPQGTAFHFIFNPVKLAGK